MAHNYFYIALHVSDGGKNYAYAIRVSSSDNLTARLRIPGLVAANIMPTKKAARQTVEAWRASFRANDSYMFDSPLF